MYTGSLQEVCGIQEASLSKRIFKHHKKPKKQVDNELFNIYKYHEKPNQDYENMNVGDHAVGAAGAAYGGSLAGPAGIIGGYTAGYLGSKAIRLLNQKMNKELHRSR